MSEGQPSVGPDGELVLITSPAPPKQNEREGNSMNSGTQGHSGNWCTGTDLFPFPKGDQTRSECCFCVLMTFTRCPSRGFLLAPWQGAALQGQDHSAAELRGPTEWPSAGQKGPVTVVAGEKKVSH